MANVNLAYQYDAYPEYAPSQDARQRQRRADIRAMRTGERSAADPNAALLVTAARLAAVVLVLVAVLAFARIALTNAAVTTMIESDALSAQISEARSSGVSLEMEQSVLSSTSALKAAVKRLHMAAPGSVGTLVLEPDVVARDANGTLSLSDSVKNVVSAQK